MIDLNDGGSMPPQRVPTGVPGLDAILHGGLVRGGLYRIAGPAGVGKTVLCNQIAFAHVRNSGRAVYVTLLAEMGERLLAHLRDLSFFDPNALARTLHYFSGYSSLEQGGLDALNDLLWRVIRDHQATLLVIDGEPAMAEAAASDASYRRFLEQLAAASATLACTTIIQGQAGGPRDATTNSMVDGYMALHVNDVPLGRVRELEVVKLRGSGYLEGCHSFEISSNGVAAYPRIETHLGRGTITQAPERRRLRFGIERLDEMMGGGAVAGSSTMLLGSLGTGKTLLGLHFLADGIADGEPSLYFGFRESETEILDMGEAFGMDLRGGMQRGVLELTHQSPLDEIVDRHVERLLDMVRRRNVRRLFIDSVRGFEEAMLRPERATRFFLALFGELKAMGVTTVYSVEQAAVVSPELQLPLQWVAAVSDSTILLRYVELHSQLYRLVSVLRMRGSIHDTAIREFQIGAGRIDIAATFSSAEAILTGTAHPLPGVGAGLLENRGAYEGRGDSP